MALDVIPTPLENAPESFTSRAVDLFAVALAGLVVPVMISQWTPLWFGICWGLLYVALTCVSLFSETLASGLGQAQRLSASAMFGVALLWAVLPWAVSSGQFEDAAVALTLMTVVVVAADSIYLPFIAATTWLAPTLALAVSLGTALVVRGFFGLAVTVAVFSLYMIIGGRRISGLFEELRGAEQSERLARSRYEHQATTDALTGYMNRRGAMSMLQRMEGQIELALFDIDNFKQVNDHYDHSLGDQAIKATLRRLEERLGPSWTVARLAGDEVLAFSEDASSDIEDLELTRIVCTGRFRDRPVVVPLTISGGVTTGDLTKQSISQIFSDADQALGVAKRTGKRKVLRLSDLTELDDDDDAVTFRLDESPTR